LGQANRTERAALADNDPLAVLLNAALTGATNLTQTHKTVYEIYARSWLVDHLELSAVDSATLLTIAVQHPAQAGEAVYTARVMLGVTVDDATGGYNFRLLQPQEPEATAAVDVFPNPAAQSVTINTRYAETDVVVFSLFDLSGRLVLVQQLPTGNASLAVDLGTVQPGAYLYQVTVNGLQTATERLVIAR
jgi:hypothetical protein